MIKELLIVGAGSFVGGGLRYAVSQALHGTCAAFPLGTFAVNVLGCLLIGFISGLDLPGSWLSPATRLLLTTGFCGGFTTFSTFINEGSTLLGRGSYCAALLYAGLSLALGLLAVAAGHWLAKTI